MMRGLVLRRTVRPLASTVRTQLRRQHVSSDHGFTNPLEAVDASGAPKDIAFCFDIDGVLLRHATPIAGAIESLRALQAHRVPFILLTNGGGKLESERVADLSKKLSVPLDTSLFVQSHTPFSEIGDRDNLKDKCVLVLGGDGPKCREVAESYGYTNVVTSADIFAAHPEIWPFGKNFMDYYRSFARPLPKPVNPTSPEDSLKIDAVFVFNDPRDWGLDIQLLIDLTLSREGILGTVSSKNGNKSLANGGLLQDGQPKLYFSNPDVLWAADYALPRLGQGAFRKAFLGAWNAVTAVQYPSIKNLQLKCQYDLMGKPFRPTYEFAERQLLRHRQELLGPEAPALKTVYMIGDNIESDIRGANSYKSPHRIDWVSILTKTGVYDGSPINDNVPKRIPRHIVQDVAAAVALGLKRGSLQ